MSDQITYIGNTDYRARNVKFGIKEGDRTRHMYIIGKTGMGKSTLIENMIIQDIYNGNGLCFIDPHGSSAETLLKYIPEHRIKDVIYFAPHDMEYPLALNVLEQVDENQRHLVANGLMAAFKKIFGEEKFSDRIQYILNNIILALLENEGQTLLGVNRMLSDANYRKFILSNVKDPSVRAFWTEEYVRAGEKYAQEAAPGIQNKIGQFISNPLIRNIIGQKKTSFDIRKIMDEKKILICNFSIGRMGEGNVNLLGNLMITKIYIAAMSRANLGAEEMTKTAPFYFYVDEFQNFVNESFAQILSQARKYNLALTVAHQYIEQMTEEVAAAVFGNVGSMILFRVGADDAEKFEKEFAPQFTMDDIVNLSARQIYLRLSIDGVGSKPFSATTLPPIKQENVDNSKAVVANTRDTYAKTKQLVEEEVLEFYKPIVPVSANKGAVTKAHTNTSPTANHANTNHAVTPKDEHHKVERSNIDKHSTDNTNAGRSGPGINGAHAEKPDARKIDSHSSQDNKAHTHKGDNDKKIDNQNHNKPAHVHDRPKVENKANNSLRDALHVALGINGNQKIDISKAMNKINEEKAANNTVAQATHTSIPNKDKEIESKKNRIENEISSKELEGLLHNTDLGDNTA